MNDDIQVYLKLSSIQRRLIAPKGEYNDFGKYPYRSCEDILKALKPLLDEYKCCLHLNNELINLGNRYYIEATAKLIDLESGKAIESKAQAREEESKKGMDGSQVTGASSSYARKYALAGLFCIDNEKDSDATNDTVRDAKQQTKVTQRNVDAVTNRVSENLNPDNRITKAQISNINNMLKIKNVDIAKIYSRYEVDDLSKMSYEQASHCIKSLNNTN